MGIDTMEEIDVEDEQMFLAKDELPSQGDMVSIFLKLLVPSLI